VPALIGLAANAVGAATGSTVEPTTAAINAAAANATPEQLLELKKQDDEVKIKAQALGFTHEEEMRRLDVQEEQLYVGDTSDARHVNGQDRGVFWLAIAIIVLSALMMCAVLYGCYQLITGGLTLSDAGTVAAIFTLIGAVIRDIDSRAQQVVSYFFGSSRGSSTKTDAMADAFRNIAGPAKDKPQG
jgi:hypothetical protein